MKELVVDFKRITKSFLRPVPSTAGESSKTNIFRRTETEKIYAVNNISFQIKAGESVAFIGPNGSGKSTSIKMMTGILTPDIGNLEVLGLSPQTERVKLTKKIGCVFGQKSNLWFHLPPADSFKLLGKIYDVDNAELEVRQQELIEAFKLSEFVNTPVRKLSLGQRMKCEIVSTLLHKPEIIFLDEPTIGLDVVAKAQIREELCRLNEEEGITIFLTSHDAGDVDQIANRTIVVNRGKLLYDGTTQELKEHYVHTNRVEIISEPSMEEIISEIYADAGDGTVIGKNTEDYKSE
jgi:ABC-2 type transport system ATP-binding protein